MSFINKTTFNNNSTLNLFYEYFNTTFSNNNKIYKNINEIKNKINEFYLNKNYKLIILFIENQCLIEIEDEFFIILFYIKIKCYFKIIEKKLNSIKIQNGFYIFNNKMKISKTLEKLFKKIKKEFKIIKYFNKKNIKKREKEKIFQIFLEGIFLYCKYLKIKNFNNDAIYLLNLCKFFIDSYYNFFIESESFNLMTKILLFLCNFLINDFCFCFSLEILNFCFKLNLKEFYLIYNKKNLNELKHKEKKKIKNNIFNLIIIFYYYGICNENLNLIFPNSLISYSNCFYFINKFKFYFNFNHQFFILIKETKNLCIKYYKIDVEFLMHEKKNKIFNQNNLNNENNKKNNFSFNFRFKKKYDYLLFFLQKNFFFNNQFNFVPETINTINNKKDFLRNLKFYNDLLSKKYVNFIRKNDNLHFNKNNKSNVIKLDNYNKNILISNKKKEDKIKNKSFQLISNKNNKNNNKNNKNLIISRNLRQNKKFLFGSLFKSSSSNLISNKKNIFKNKSLKFLNSINNEKRSNSEKIKNKKVKKYSLNFSYIFSKKYQKNRTLIESYSNKEIEFQKNLLFLKQNDSKNMKETFILKNKKNVLNDAENFFNKTLDFIETNNKKNNKIINNKIKNYNENFNDSFNENYLILEKLEIKKNKLKDKIIKGNNYKIINNYNDLNKKIKNFRKFLFLENSFSNENNKSSIINKNHLYNFNNIHNNNNNFLSLFNEKIQNYNETIKKMKKK